MNKEFIVVIFSENQIGILNRITACYLRRKINIESLKVSESSIKGISMFVISAFSTQEIIDKLVKQVSNIIDVIEVQYYTQDELITQEIALYKVSSKLLPQNGRIDALTTNWGARLIEMGQSFVVLEKTGTREEVENFKNYLEKDGLLIEFTRSGSVVLHRESIEDKLHNTINNNN